MSRDPGYRKWGKGDRMSRSQAMKDMNWLSYEQWISRLDVIDRSIRGNKGF